MWGQEGGGGGSAGSATTDNTSSEGILGYHSGAYADKYGTSSSSPLSAVTNVLLSFGKHPAAFIIGTIVSLFLNGMQALVIPLYNAVMWIFVGSGPGTQGQLGLADIPLYLSNILVGVGKGPADAFLGVINTLTSAGVWVAMQAGPLSGIILTIEAVAAIGIIVYGGKWAALAVLEVA